MKKRIIFILLCMFSAFSMTAQISMQNIGAVNVDNLTDTQIQEFVAKYTGAGYSFADVEAQAKARGMQAGEVEKLRARIQTIGAKSASAGSAAGTAAEGREMQQKITQVTSEEQQKNTDMIKNASRVFGADLFHNSNLTFEPNSNIPTPKNYQLGADDELIIDIFGYSENTLRIKVSPEGFVRIPNVGQVQVSGQTIENAEKIIKKQLSTIYSTINTGQTQVTVTLGNIRSIKVYLVGEVAKPGTYTLSSLSTVFNALYTCGGPSQNGSMRNIKVLRNGKVIATVDLYTFLLNGELKNNVTLQEQDVVQVPPYESHVTIEGDVKRIGIYEMKPDETVNDLIAFAGGFTDDAYKGRISVVRNTDNEKSVADVPKELYGMFHPQSGDKYLVGGILDKYTNRVQITGNIFRPGIYALDEGMTLNDLVKKADGLREDAFMQRATIARLKDDLTPEIIAFNVQDLIDGKFNILLKKEDIVTIGTKTEYEESKTVSIYGEVMSEGVFPYYENMTLKDIIFLAKGFKEFAETEKIEITRRIIDPETLKTDAEKVEIILLSVDKDLHFSEGDGSEFPLLPRDQISVRLIEGMEPPAAMRLLGEVRSPGSYTIVGKTERISDVLKRAGGLTNYAYAKGAFLIRSSNRTQAELMRDMKLIALLTNTSSDLEKEQIRQEFLNRTDLVGIYLDKIVEKPRSKSDVFVENGDIIYVPKQLQTVTISGAVQVTGMTLYDGTSFKHYISQSGGFGANADKRHSYVAYANGTIASTKRVLFWNSYPKVEPGAHVFVTEKPAADPNKTKENVAFFTTILGSFVSISSVVLTSIILMNK